MKKFNEKYDIGRVSIPLSELSVIDPATVAKDGEFFYLSNYSIKRLATVLGMGSGQLSTKLYSLDPEIWKALLEKRLAVVDTQNQCQRNNALVIDDMLVTISEGNSCIEDVIESINKFIEDEELRTYYSLIDKELLVVVSVNDKGYGVLIKYYFQDNWAVVHDCLYDEKSRKLLLAPYYALDKKVDSDIKELLDKDMLIGTAASTLPYQAESYRNKMDKTFMSVEELCYYFKKYMKIKLGVDPFNVYDYAADNESISSLVVEKLNKIINKLYDIPTAPMVINSSYLKKAISITNISYGEFSDLLEALFLEDGVHINNLIDFQMKVLKGDTHFDQLNS